MSNLSKRIQLLLFVSLILIGIWLTEPSNRLLWALYGLVTFSLLIIKGGASFAKPKVIRREMNQNELVEHKNTRIAAVIPSHNEDPAALQASVESLINHEKITGIVLIDDASTDSSSIQSFEKIKKIDPDRILVFTFRKNRGKRWGLNIGVRKIMKTWNPDYIITVDSDTIVNEDCIDEALDIMVKDKETGAVTALVRARNWNTNFLTRMQDIRYSNAFLFERAAYSSVGSVLCVCGSFTMWRASLLHKLVKPLVQQTWLGQECTYGDDRHLTNLALKNGWKIRLSETAIADTLVPESPRHWLNQQLRWAKSFIRESIWAIRNLPFGWPLVLSMIEFSTWFIFTGVLIISLVIQPFVTGQLALGAWIFWVTLMSWARATRYPSSRAEIKVKDTLIAMAIMPIYGIIHIILLVPMRLLAALQMKNTSWGTRQSIEVEDVISI